jgi:hypothetical protein
MLHAFCEAIIAAYCATRQIVEKAETVAESWGAKGDIEIHRLLL